MIFLLHPDFCYNLLSVTGYFHFKICISQFISQFFICSGGKSMYSKEPEFTRSQRGTSHRKRASQERKFSPPGIILILICLAVFVFCLYKLLPKASEYHKSAKIYREIREDAVIPHSPDQSSIGSGNKTLPDTDTIDWELFKDMDVVAWLMLDDISYPVLQGDDNSEYLHALPDHTYNYGGSILLDSVNSRYLSDRNSIIYGHNMADGSMFGKFHSRYINAEYRDHTFCLYLPNGTRRTYTFFSVLTTEAGSRVYSYAFENSPSFLNWQNMLKSSTRYENSPKPDKNARFVSLSTCDGMAGTTRRLVIIGKETNLETIQQPASWYVPPEKKDPGHGSTENINTPIKHTDKSFPKSFLWIN